MEETNYSAFTVDVEDGINIAMRDFFNINIPPTERVLKNLDLIVSLLSEKSVKATFFMLGEIAETFPAKVKEISSLGHEIGIHGYYHDQFFRLSPEKARNDLYRAKSLVEDLTGKNVNGFRAPAFSISSETAWALEILANLGFKYDSSIMPVKADRYGWAGFEKKIHKLFINKELSLIEVPLSTINLLGKKIPACGGGYLRHLPLLFTQSAFRKIVKQQPVIVYLHPYELDQDKYPSFFYDAIKSSNFKRRISLSIYRLNKGTVERKLRALLEEFKFKPVIELIEIIENKEGLESRFLS